MLLFHTANLNCIRDEIGNSKITFITEQDCDKFVLFYLSYTAEVHDEVYSLNVSVQSTYLEQMKKANLSFVYFYAL